MKILICAGYYYPHVGGYEKNVHELARRLVNNGHKVTVMVSANGEDEMKDGVNILRFASWDWFGSPIMKPTTRLHYFYGVGQFDVVITQTRFFFASLFGMIYAKKHKIPLIHVERGSSHSVVGNKAFSLAVKLYDHTVGRYLIKSADVNIGVSRRACEFVRHIGGEAKEICNGIEVYVNGNRNTYDICFVGRLIYGKGVQDLIEAFRLCCQERSDLRLVIIGDGNYRNELEKLAIKSGYRSKILFFGTQEPDDAMRMMGKSDIFVNPSYSEGLPTSVMEAASIGKPIIATDVGGTMEIITHGETGIIYQPHDVEQLHVEIMGLLGDMRKARRMGIMALQTVTKKYSWDNVVLQYEQLLKEVCQK